MSDDLQITMADAVWHYADKLHAAGITSIVGPPEEIAEQIGRALIKEIGAPFRIGRRILTLLSPGGYLLPPSSFRFFRENIKLRHADLAPFIEPWSVVLWQSGYVPAVWQIGGTVRWPDGSTGRRWWRLLHLDENRDWARTDEGWVKLGTWMHS